MIITPIHLPSNFRDRRDAMRPTRVRTESRTSLLLSDQVFHYTSRLLRGNGGMENARIETRRRVECDGGILRFGTELSHVN